MERMAGKIMKLAAGEARILVPATFCLFLNSALGQRGGS